MHFPQNNILNHCIFFFRFKLTFWSINQTSKKKDSFIMYVDFFLISM
jgi:hypothetical protein